DGHSISAGLDYPGVGPEHSWLRDSGRVEYVPILDDEALEAFQLTTKVEGIIPALESAPAVAHAGKLAPTLPKDQIVIVNLSGRGDKDVRTVAKMMAMEIWYDHPHRSSHGEAEDRGPAGARHLLHGRRCRLRHLARDHEVAA